MQDKPPIWVFSGAFLLTTVAGCVNAVGFLGMQHRALTHVTGAVANAALHLVDGDFASGFSLFGVFLSFILGGVVSGVLIPNHELGRNRSYSTALVLESGLLLTAMELLVKGVAFGEYVAIFAIGLQNGLATSYSGSVIRTSHVTGLVTDLGLALSNVIRGRPLNRFRVKIQSTIIFGFFVGCMAGATLYRSLGVYTLAIPAATVGIAGVGYALALERAK